MTSGLGSVVASLPKDVSGTGLRLTATLNSVNVWSVIDTRQTPNYNVITDSQTPNWSAFDG